MTEYFAPYAGSAIRLPRFRFRLPRLTLDDGKFEESKHPRGNSENAGQFSKGAGGGSTTIKLPSAAVHKTLAEKYSNHMLKGTSSERGKLRTLLKQTDDPLAQAHIRAALKQSRKIQANSQAVKQILSEKELSWNKAPGGASEQSNAEAVEAWSKKYDEKHAPQATEPELAQARKTVPLPLGYGAVVQQGAPNVPLGTAAATLIDQFNKAFTGPSTPTTPGGLNAKVAAFKKLKEQAGAAQKAYEAERVKEQKASAAKTEAEFHNLPRGDGKTALALGKELGSVFADGQAYLSRAKEKKSSYPALAGISDGDLAAVIAYTGSGYGKINKQLRSGKMTPHMHEIVLAANSALEKMPSHVGLVRRGAYIEGDAASLYEPGMIIEERGFTSTSRGSGNSGGLQFHIKSRTGKDVSGVSLHPGEQEVLFRSGSRFRVLRKSGNEVHMEEVEQVHHV